MLVVDAEVLAPAAAVPPPGFMRALQVDRYRVLRVISGSYDHEELYAARDAGASFAIGARLLLTLERELPEGASAFVTDPLAVNRLGLYYVVAFERLSDDRAGSAISG